MWPSYEVRRIAIKHEFYHVIINDKCWLTMTGAFSRIARAASSGSLGRVPSQGARASPNTFLNPTRITTAETKSTTSKLQIVTRALVLGCTGSRLLSPCSALSPSKGVLSEAEWRFPFDDIVGVDEEGRMRWMAERTRTCAADVQAAFRLCSCELSTRWKSFLCVAWDRLDSDTRFHQGWRCVPSSLSEELELEDEELDELDELLLFVT